jgi:hypothetical protein
MYDQLTYVYSEIFEESLEELQIRNPCRVFSFGYNPGV